MPATPPPSTALFRRPQPEDLEITYRRAELAELRAALTAREQQLAHLRDQLHSFEGRYIRQVGVLYIQLDEWEQRLADLIASRDPAAPATDGYWSAERLEEQARLAEAATSEPEPDPRPALDLQSLFREVAKRIHPDFADGPADELRRTRLMAEANEALRRGDAELLHRMIHSHDLRPHNETPAAELARLRSLIDQTQRDLCSLEVAFTALATSEMAQLRDTTVREALQGRDHLAEMAARVKGSIGVAMGRYEREASPNRRPAPIDPESLLTAESKPARFQRFAKR
jgi:hypothetical protein